MKKILVVLSLVFCALMLVSCGMSDNPIDIQKNLEDEGYGCMIYGGEVFLEEIGWLLEEYDVSNDGIKSVLVAYDGEDTEGLYNSEKYLVVLFCEDAKAAKDIEKDFLDGLDDDEWVDYVKDSFNIKSEKKYEAGRSGSVVYIGHADLVKAAK